MNYAEMLKKLRDARQKKLEDMQSIHQKASDDNRTFTEAETGTFEALRKEVEGLDAQIDSTLAMEKLMGRSATAVDDPSNPVAKTTPQAKTGSTSYSGASQSNLPKGTVFTRYAMALAASKGNLHQACEIAKAHWSDSTPQVERILKAAVAAGTTTDTTWAKPLAEYREAANEFIELLRPATILGAMTGFRAVPFNVRIPRQTAGASVGWVGQGAPKPVNKLAFDSVIIPITKVAGIVVITQELARYSQPSAEALVRSDLVSTIANFMDAQMINPAIAAVANVSPASVTNGAPSLASTGATLSAILADSTAAMTSLAVANIPMMNWYWVMHPRTAMFLADIRTAQDVYAFPGMALPMGQKMFRGLPVVISTGVPFADPDGAGAAGVESTITLIATGEILVADDGDVMLDVSTEAAVAMDDTGAGTLTSLWQNNLIGIRAERYIHWLRRRPAAVFVITNVAY